ncbi:hypothetical protein QCA50_009267 [Cerrena zonata]|uniref:Protein-serine/threonine kinase n=1 Tax=Cerrena zonata TaxID=2478898 RepID=A0AAW0GBW0_9APHY
MYLKSMSALLNASLNPPLTVKDNEEFQESTLNAFINIHADTLPGLSKGFGEVIHLISLEQIKQFLDVHLKERISMRLIVHQHIELSKALNNPAGYEKGGDFNGVIKNLNILDIVRKNAELVNDICLMKYDTAIPIKIDHNLYPTSYWSRRDPPLQLDEKTGDVFFPYIEYHLDYIFMELFKNAFRSHAENKISDPVQITISTSSNPSYLEVRIRDKGKGISQNTLNHIFDYSFTTYESNEGEAYKTLNVPPGLGGNTVAGMGYGLPLLKNYVEIFNDTLHEHSDDGPSIKGLLSVQSYYGWGTDVYLKTPSETRKSNLLDLPKEYLKEKPLPPVYGFYSGNRSNASSNSNISTSSSNSLLQKALKKKAPPPPPPPHLKGPINVPSRQLNDSKIAPPPPPPRRRR